MVFNEEDKILIKNLYNCKGYSARQLISATRAGLSTACARNRWAEETPHRQLVKYPARTSSRRSLTKRFVSSELCWGHAFQRQQADILNICCNVLVLHYLSAVFTTMFYLNIPDNLIVFKLTWRKWRWFMYAAFHKALYWYPLRDTNELGAVLLQIY